jgi:GMP synthase (glutamine-hydrolysing)
MSHGDRVTQLPPASRSSAVSRERALRHRRRRGRRIYTTMFHPEVVHTPDGAKLLSQLRDKIAGLKGDWTMAALPRRAIAKIRAQVGKGRVICGLSGGVDSSVAAVLIHEAIGDQLTCVFVDTA